MIGDRTRLVAVTAASNAIGTRPDVRAIADRAHQAGALTYVDGVHATPHAPTDIAALGADFYACSSYKWFGPHAGAVIADPALLASLEPRKLVPSPDQGPERFERGTASFEQLAGVAAAVDWIAGLTDTAGSRRQRVLAAMGAIERYLDELAARRTRRVGGVSTGSGSSAPRRVRTSTISFTVRGVSPADVAAALQPRRRQRLGRRQLRLRADASDSGSATAAARSAPASCSTTTAPTCSGCSTRSPQVAS